MPPHAGHAVTVPESMLRDQRVLRYSNRSVTVRDRKQSFRDVLAELYKFNTYLHFCASREMWSRIVTNDSVFMVHFKLACVRDNVLMKHKKSLKEIRHIRHSHGSCVVGHTGHGSHNMTIVSSAVDYLI